MSMVTDTEENLVEFSKKFLDSVFGGDTAPDLNLPQIDTPSKPSTDHLAPPPFLTISQSQGNPEPENNDTVNKSIKRISQDSFSSVQTSESVASSIDSCDVESTLADIREAAGRGFEATLKRRSIVALDCDVNRVSTDEDGTTNELHIETNNPSHLFWVPAHLHPEIDPNEFKKWLQNHAKDGFHTGPSAIKRRKSLLSQQYIPHENDGVGEDDQLEMKPLPEKKADGFDWENYGSEGNISPSAEATKLNILRRSLSLNLPPFLELNNLQIFDRNSKPGDDSPVLVPRVVPALKRAARTRIRRNSIAGEQNPRRMSGHRRTKSTHVSLEKDRLEANALPVPAEHAVPSKPVKSEGLPIQNEKSAGSSDGRLPSPKKAVELERINLKDDPAPIRITLNDEPEQLYQKPISARPHRTSSLPPDAGLIADALQPGSGSKEPKKKTSQSLSTSNSTNPSSTVSPHKRSTWAWLSWGSSDDKEGRSKKSRTADRDTKGDRSKADIKLEKDAVYDEESSVGKETQPDHDTSPISLERTDSEAVGEPVAKEKSKMSLSALFSWTSQNKSKSADATALLVTPPAPASQPQSEPQSVPKRPKYTNYSRLPLHVERAIYRLSHVKLANPRRPLHEQVLISNMMFWYLSLINKQQEEYGGGNPKAQKEAMKVKSKLIKQGPGRKRRKADKKGADPKRRHPAEMAYKAPQYDMQQVQIAQQYFAVPDVQGPYQEEYSNHSDGDSDCSPDSADEFTGHSYHHYNDGYTSDGTEGGLLGNGVTGYMSGEMVHGGMRGDAIDGAYPQSPSKERPPSPNGRPISPDTRRPPPSPSSRPPPSTKRGLGPGNMLFKSSSKARMRPSGPAVRNGKVPATKVSQDQASDEDDDVPLGLQFSSAQHA